MKYDAADLRVEVLGASHDRAGFACGVESLDRYLKTQASQDARRRANAVFVMVEIVSPTVIVGYFSLCATSLSPGDVPEAARKFVPRYPLVSATLLARLAIARERQGEGLGGILLELLRCPRFFAAWRDVTVGYRDATHRGAAGRGRQVAYDVTVLALPYRVGRGGMTL